MIFFPLLGKKYDFYPPKSFAYFHFFLFPSFFPFFFPFSFPFFSFSFSFPFLFFPSFPFPFSFFFGLAIIFFPQPLKSSYFCTPPGGGVKQKNIHPCLMCVPNLLKYNARVFVSLIFVSRFRSEENVIALTLWWHGLPDWFLLDVEHFYSCCERLTDSQRVRERERERERQTDRQTEIGREKLHIYKKFLPFRLQPQQTNWLFK